MPKKTNTFQKLVRWCRQHVTVGTIEESRLLVDTVTGGTASGPLHRDRGRRSAAPDLRGVCREGPPGVRRVGRADAGQALDLPTSILVLASQAGFSAVAERKARHYEIDTIDLREIDAAAGTISQDSIACASRSSRSATNT